MSRLLLRGTATILLALAGACHAPPATLARTHPAPPTLEVSGPLHWSDRVHGEVEATIACRRTTIEVWCREQGRTRCDSRRVLAETVACPAAEVTLTTGAGAVAEATVTPDGRATFPAGTATTVDGRVRIEHEGLTMAWRDGETLLVEAERPVVVAEPPRPQRSYVSTMAAADIALAVTAPLVIGKTRSPTVGLLYLGAYLAAGPVIHRLNGNRGAIGWSLARRALYPAIGVAIAAAAYSGGGDGCDGEPCFLGEGGGAVLATATFGLGIVAAMIHDWTAAHVDAIPASVTPVVSSDGEHTSFGVAGRF